MESKIVKPWGVTYEEIICDDRDEWLSIRSQGIGGSEVASILGVDGAYHSPYSLWLNKSGLGEIDRGPSEIMRWGIRLEDVIREGYSEETGRSFEPVSTEKKFVIWRDPEHPWRQYSPDGIVSTPDGELMLGECKNSSAFMLGAWADEPPEIYQCQVQYGMGISGLRTASFAALIGGNNLKAMDLDFHEDLWEAMAEEVDEFWELVQSGVAPDPDAHKETRNALFRHLGLTPETIVDLSPKAVQAHHDLEEAKVAFDSAKELVELHKNQILAEMNGNAIGVIPGTEVAYKHARRKRKGYTVEDAIYDDFRKGKAPKR